MSTNDTTTTGPAAAEVAAQENLAAAQDEVIANTTEPTTDADAPEGEPTTDADAPAPVRATWKQHGNPTKGWTYFGTAVKEPDAKGVKITKVEVGAAPSGVQSITLHKRGGVVGEFATATKMWAIVPADAPRAEVAAKPKGTGAPGAPRREVPFQGTAAPEGYVVRWSGKPIAPATDYLKAEAKDTTPQWLVRCNQHGTTSPAKSVEDCKKVGTLAQRITWCPECKKAEAAK